MVERSVALPEARGMANRPFQVGARRAQRVLDGVAHCEIGGDRGRQRAARPVSMPGGYPGTPELELGVGRAHHVHGVIRSEVPSLHHYDARPHRADPPRSRAHVVYGGDAAAGERLRLGNVRRQHLGKPEQVRLHCRHRILLQQAVAPLGDHHRIDDEFGQLEPFDRRGDRLDDRRRGQHACLHRSRREIADDRFDLRDDQFGRDRFPRGHAQRVLRGDGGDGAGAVDAVRREGLEIRLDAGAASRVAARDCQCGMHTVQFRPMNTRIERFDGTLLDALPVRADLSSAFRAGAVLFVAVLTIAAAQISVPLPFTPVPFTLQPMVVLLGGAALGARLGMSSQILYLAVGIAGLPVFAASPILPQGFGRLLGPTGGYLMSYPFAALLTGYLAGRGFDRRYLTSVLAMGAGLALIFACGVAWMAWGAPHLGLAAAVRGGLVPFIPADIVKVFLAATLLPAAWKFLRTADR